jgi:hypothetical protein
VNDQGEARRKARQFADSVFIAAVDTNARTLQEQLVDVRARAAARSAFPSGITAQESAKVYGKFIDTVVQARLDALLEGYELHRVQLDHELASNILDDVMRCRDVQIRNVIQAMGISSDSGLVTADVFAQMVQSECMVSRGFVNVQIQRRRLAPKPEASTMNITYQLIGNASRVNVNSTDNSTNVTISESELFSKMREEISEKVPSGEGRDRLLQKVSALEKERDLPSAWERYKELIGVAAEHMTLMCPFIPALTEMIGKAIR